MKSLVAKSETTHIFTLGRDVIQVIPYLIDFSHLNNFFQLFGMKYGGGALT